MRSSLLLNLVADPFSKTYEKHENSANNWYCHANYICIPPWHFICQCEHDGRSKLNRNTSSDGQNSTNFWLCQFTNIIKYWCFKTSYFPFFFFIITSYLSYRRQKICSTLPCKSLETPLKIRFFE